MTTSLPMEGDTLPRLLDHAEVEDRLVEAMITCWRDRDRERGWQRVQASWPEMRRHTWFGDYGEQIDGASGGELRTAAMTRRDQAEMEEAFGWVDALAPDDRRVVAAVIADLAGGRREIDWSRIMRRIGVKRGRDGVRMRYSRAIASIAAAQSRRNPREQPSTPTKSR